jgi:ubiquitin-protein ligase
MASIIRSLSDKESNHGGEVSDLDDLFDSSTTTTTLPIVVGEMSSEVFNSLPSTTTQQLYYSQPSHRTISGGVEVEEDEQDLLANLVVAEDEGIPFVEEDQQERMMETEIVEEEDDEEEEDDYEYEDDDYAAFSGFLVNNDPSVLVPFSTNTSSTNNGNESRPATIEEEVIASSDDALRSSSPVASSYKPKWRQPSEEAVNMSIRASTETSGNKRRLALDLYRIMNQDTDQAGFALFPKNDDCMDSWVIKLFQFDEDSKLAQDMKVLNVPFIELEMNFPDQYPFEPPFVRVSKPRFRRQTGFVMNGALCMELLTKVC